MRVFVARPRLFAASVEQFFSPFLTTKEGSGIIEGRNETDDLLYYLLRESF